MFSMKCRKNVAVEDHKKRMNVANFINIYIYIYIYANIYTYIICDENDSINSIPQHGHNCYVVFPTSRFSYLILCTR